MDEKQINDLIKEKREVQKELEDIEKKKNKLTNRLYELEDILGFNCKHKLEKVDYDNYMCIICGFISL